MIIFLGKKEYYISFSEKCEEDSSFVHTPEECIALCRELAPDTVILQITGYASSIQDLLHLIYKENQHPHIIIFEEKNVSGEKRILYSYSVGCKKSILNIFRNHIFNTEEIVFPEYSFQQRFPEFMRTHAEREMRKVLLYGVNQEDFKPLKERYHLRLSEGGYYLYVWELGKQAIPFYSTDYRVYYYLHALRLENFEGEIRHCGGCEILFSDITFAYILINVPQYRSAALKTQHLQNVYNIIKDVSGECCVYNFISDVIAKPSMINDGYQSYQKVAACRFFCGDVRILTPGYIRSHRRWIEPDVIRETTLQIQGLIKKDFLNPELDNLLRSLYLEIIKPSMSYMLYHITNESILIQLESEKVAKNILDDMNDPLAIINAKYSSIEESLLRMLNCIASIRRQLSIKHAIGKRVQETVNILDTEYAKDISLRSLTHRLSISQTQLSADFRREIGMSIKQYLIELRIRNAKKLLLSTDLPVNNIAEKVGFMDSRNFSKSFKKHTGLSPREYRRTMGNDELLFEQLDHFSINLTHTL